METNNIIIYLACIIAIFIVGKIFIIPLKKILKLIFNSILGTNPRELTFAFISLINYFTWSIAKFTGM